jgi:hypothetical protein
VGVGSVIPSAGQCLFEGGFESGEVVAVVSSRRLVERLREEIVDLRVSVEQAALLECEEQSTRFPLACQAMALDQLAVKVHRGVQQGLDGPPGFHHAAGVAPPCEAPEPGPQVEVESRLDVERGIPLEHRLEGPAERIGLRERQDVARADQAAITVGTPAGEPPPVDHGDVPPGFEQEMGARRADHARADDDGGFAHLRRCSP